MNCALRDRLLALAEADLRDARAVYEASQRHEAHRGRFLFDIPRGEWLPEYLAAAESASARVAELKELIGTHGWPSEATVGEDAARAAWLLAQHAGKVDPAFQQECERRLAGAVDRGEAKPGQLAALRDRIQLEAGRSQLYGTHLEPHGGTWGPVRGIDDPKAVDARRALLGLKPWQEYLSDCLRGVTDT